MKEKQELDNVEPADEKIKIDYDKIDVSDIMSQIKKKIAAQPKVFDPPGTHAWQDPGTAPMYSPEPREEESKSGLKRIIIKLMRPFAPIVKLLAYPVYEELRETIKLLDETNRRLDHLHELHNHHVQELKRTIDVVDGKANNFNINVNERIDTAFTDIHKLKEYTKLLHGLSHNMVVELTKLRIEEENLKLKARILEKDFEFLGRKEKALEKEVYK
ncbi:hypothetical protein ACFLT9_01195 [Acidobacteriota bacterium]